MSTTVETAKNTEYQVFIDADNKRYNVSKAVISLDTSEQEKQLAVCATIELCDVEVDGQRLSDLIFPPNRVWIFVHDSEKDSNREVFRGYIWEISPKESLTDNNISLKCYDMLIYWQESEDSIFFSAGRDTQGIMKELAKNWGFSLTYNYENKVHEKLVLRGAIADFVIADILDPMQKEFGTKYVIRSEKTSVIISPVGQNDTVYTIGMSHNATEVRRYISMNGVITQVIVLGTADDDDKSPIEATVTGHTSSYGTLQKIITKNEDTDLRTSKIEAKNIVDNEGTPKWEHDIKAVDIPWIRKGDKVEITTETLNGTFIVLGVNREISNRGKNMTLTVIKGDTEYAASNP